MNFKGRVPDLDLLSSQLQQVTKAQGDTRGRAMILTGQRRVGKSRLAQEFCDRSGAPQVIFQATRGRNPERERADFMTMLAQSDLPGGGTMTGLRAASWDLALFNLALALPDDTPSIAVIDEVPWLMEQDREFERALHIAWDQHLSRKPVLLLLIGSDLSVMEALPPDAARMTVSPLHLADVQAMTGLTAADAIDALLITGGFPEVVQDWQPGMKLTDYLRHELGNPLSPLLMAGQLTMLGEFPGATYSRAVLEAAGSGERTFTTVAAAAGRTSPLASGTLTPILSTLVSKQVLAIDRPLSGKPDTKNNRYRIADPYLRFWLAFLDHGIPLVERGRADLLLERIERAWPAWRSRAVEPVIRASLLRLLPDDRWPGTEAVGGWWNRQNDPEIGLVGADREPVAGHIHFAGSIRWLDTQPFGVREYGRLSRDMLAVPGAGPDTPLVAVSRSGVEDSLPLAAHWGPDDLLRAWPS